MFLVKQGYTIVARNYWKKWGEIDIIAQKAGITHFVEVKSVSCESLDTVFLDNQGYKPEDNIHEWKQKRLSRVIQTYMVDHDMGQGGWQIDIISVFLDTKEKRSKIRMFENVVF